MSSVKKHQWHFDQNAEHDDCKKELQINMIIYQNSEFFNNFHFNYLENLIGLFQLKMLKFIDEHV